MLLALLLADRPGRPKGAVHVQTSLVQTAELYGQGVLGINATM